MVEELGFKTPAKEIQKLRKRLEQMEGLTGHVEDALKLSMSSIMLIFATWAIDRPKYARKEKDTLLDTIKGLGINPGLIDSLDEYFKECCDMIEKRG